MRKAGATAFAALMLLSFIPAQPISAQTKPAPKPLTLKVGDTAPDFSLLAFDGKEVKKVSLHDYRGKKNVALAFYVFAFTGG
jgi:AhpC/TSA family